MADNLILVKLTKKFADRIFHEFHPDHPHETANGHELLVTGDRVAEAARTPGVLGAIMQGVLEEVRDPAVQPSPTPVDVLDVVNGEVAPASSPADAPAADATAAGTDESAAAAASKKSSSK
jgi:hypothetical protein